MSDAPVDPSSTKAWSRLERLASDFAPDLRAWFADDPDRVGRLTFTAGDLLVDLSKSLLDDAAQVMADLKEAGIDYDDVIEVLEREGVEKFEASWGELLKTVKGQLDAAAERATRRWTRARRRRGRSSSASHPSSPQTCAAGSPTTPTGSAG